MHIPDSLQYRTLFMFIRIPQNLIFFLWFSKGCTMQKTNCIALEEYKFRETFCPKLSPSFVFKSIKYYCGENEGDKKNYPWEKINKNFQVWCFKLGDIEPLYSLSGIWYNSHKILLESKKIIFQSFLALHTMLYDMRCTWFRNFQIELNLIYLMFVWGTQWVKW